MAETWASKIIGKLSNMVHFFTWDPSYSNTPGCIAQFKVVESFPGKVIQVRMLVADVHDLFLW